MKKPLLELFPYRDVKDRQLVHHSAVKKTLSPKFREKESTSTPNSLHFRHKNKNLEGKIFKAKDFFIYFTMQNYTSQASQLITSLTNPRKDELR